jgi:hypothetical protein
MKRMYGEQQREDDVRSLRVMSLTLKIQESIPICPYLLRN